MTILSCMIADCIAAKQSVSGEVGPIYRVQQERSNDKNISGPIKWFSSTSQKSLISQIVTRHWLIIGSPDYPHAIPPWTNKMILKHIPEITNIRDRHSSSAHHRQSPLCSCHAPLQVSGLVKLTELRNATIPSDIQRSAYNKTDWVEYTIKLDSISAFICFSSSIWSPLAHVVGLQMCKYDYDCSPRPSLSDQPLRSKPLLLKTPV